MGPWAWLWNWFYFLSARYGTSIWQSLIAILILGAAAATHSQWLEYIPYGGNRLVLELGRPALIGLLAIATSLFLDTLRRRFNSDLS